MKNIFRILMAVAVLFTASCAKEDISSSIAGGEVEVTFTANLQDLGSRTYGDGSQVTTLYYYVYDSSDKELTALNGTADRVDGKFKFSLPLLKGMTYSIVFWADCGTGSIYSYDPTTKTITANYNGVLANNESLDAFYKCVTGIDPTKAVEIEEKTNVVLTRPFAQLNTLTKDYAAIENNGVALEKSKIAGVIPTTLNVLDGTIVTPTETVTLVFNTLPTDENTTDDLTPLSMNYILAPATQKFVADITVSYEGSINFPSATYTNIPLQRNYKTNIIGNLLTASTDFTVTIEAGFVGTETVNVWDGKTVTPPAYDVNSKTYTVTNGAELAWIAAAANGTTRSDVDTFIGQTIVLANDIELGGHNWTPISISKELGNGKTFRGTFDGNGKTISGLVSNQKDIAGLFGYIYAATIKNVTIKGASINSNHYAGGIVAWLLNNSGNVKIPAIIENCHVVNSTITSTPELVNGEWDNGDKAGGLVGYACFDNANNERGAGIKNCSVENTTIKAYRDFGGLVGYASYVALENCSVNNITLEQDLTHDYKAPNTPTTYGEFIGRNDGGNTVDGGQFVASGVTTKDGAYYITSAEGIAWVEAQSDAFFAGKTIKLANNIDMAGVEYNPIRFWESENPTTFDGQNYTISNITIGNNSLNTAALFNGTLSVKNLKIDNATVTGNGYVAVIGGNIYGNIDNCHISNSTVTGNYWQVGGFAGQFNSGNITNCSITNTSITGPSAVGALAGITNEQGGERKFENCTISECEIVQNYSFGGDYDLYYGVATGLINISNSTVHFNNVTVIDTNVKGVASDALFGEAADSTTIFINGATYIANGVTRDAEGNYHIYSAEGLKWVTEQVNTMEYYVNQSANIFDGKTVFIENDINLGGAEWRPIGDYAFSRTSFNGVFDGKNHTISNFKVTEPVKWTEKVAEASYGFFGNVKGTIKNITIKNATVNPNGGRFSAALVGRLHDGGLIENCHVVESSVTISHWQVGGLVGQNNNGNISDCSVVGSTITGYAAVGAIVGMDMKAGEHTIENCRVENTTLVQNGSFGASYDATYGLAVGLVNAAGITLHLNNVAIVNNTIKDVASDTLVGEAVSGATIHINGTEVQ